MLTSGCLLYGLIMFANIFFKFVIIIYSRQKADITCNLVSVLTEQLLLMRRMILFRSVFIKVLLLITFEA